MKNLRIFRNLLTKLVFIRDVMTLVFFINIWGKFPFFHHYVTNMACFSRSLGKIRDLSMKNSFFSWSFDCVRSFITILAILWQNWRSFFVIFGWNLRVFHVNSTKYALFRDLLEKFAPLDKMYVCLCDLLTAFVRFS